MNPTPGVPMKAPRRSLFARLALLLAAAAVPAALGLVLFPLVRG